MATTDLATPEREARLEDVLAAYFDAVDAGQPEDRETLLARYPELATELATFFAEQERLLELASPLRSLWQAEQVVTPLLRQPTSTPEGGDPLSPDQPPRSFGDYELLAKIGQGGMGVVYKARQKSLGRLVALKMLRGEDGDSTADVRRFRNEAETVAHLDHPNIVPIHEVSEYDGRLFFSMKLIEGGSLAEQLEHFRDDPRSAAPVVAAVARAVHHAHQRGVLRRNLKPSNILLDAVGQPHVVDFGLARRVAADRGLTQSGAIVGTPGYMSPEQTLGQKVALTTATDVYGLGAVLYALLTGRPPFQGATVLDTFLLVKEREPEPPSQHNRKLDRDLETVCLKCLQKASRGRYESAQVLAEDLEHYLAGEPVRARRAGPWERFRKWARRRPALVGLMLVTALAGMGLVVGLLWHNAQLKNAADSERQQAETARIQRDEADRQRERAEDRFRRAGEALELLFDRVVSEQELLDLPPVQKLRRDALLKVLEFYQGFLQEKSTDPSVRYETAYAYRRVGDIQRDLSGLGYDPKEKLPAYRSRKLQEAEEAYREALSRQEALVNDLAEEPKYRTELATLYPSLGMLANIQSQRKDAENRFRQCVALREQLVADFPREAAYREGLRKDYGYLAIRLEQEKDKRQEAERLYRQSLEIAKGLAAVFLRSTTTFH